MPRQRRLEVNEATQNIIKATARQCMVEKGTAGLSLRAIARQLKMTAPALYHYFTSLDELITALIVDAFTAHANYVRHVRDASAQVGEAPYRQLFAAIWAYRAWALENPIDFQLIYGNPIPGYRAPAAVTVPAAGLMGELFMEILLAAIDAGELVLAEPYTIVPPTILAHYQSRFDKDTTMGPLFHVMNQMWSMIHGLVALEIYHHLGPVVGDTDTFYRESVQVQLRSVGVQITQSALL
ncbi:MAG: TetR/AcrR family transcriptional regulator [Caldilineaceae bacterium]|nr:TetR/AcrR family transcriptional regulator [Caldilineaceae bacterium]